MKPDSIRWNDYAEIIVNGTNSKFVSSHIVKGRRIALYNIPMCVESYDDAISLVPVYPAVSRLMKIIKDNPDISEFHWVKNRKKWCIK